MEAVHDEAERAVEPDGRHQVEDAGLAMDGVEFGESAGVGDRAEHVGFRQVARRYRVNFLYFNRFGSTAA